MVRELFRLAEQYSPSIVFIDEIDAVGTKRYNSNSGGEREIQRTMLELLNQLDGFDSRGDVKVNYCVIYLFRTHRMCVNLYFYFQVVMATNRIETLDPALIRPGRIDRKIEFPPPNEEARWDILRIHSRKMNLTRGINLKKIAELMPGASGAEVKVM